MKKLNLKVAAIAVCGILVMSSCKKESNSNPGTSNAVVGEWTLVEVGEDDNKNGKLEDVEIYKAEDANVSMTMSFKADKSFSSSVNAQGQTANISGTYSFENNQIKTVANGQTETHPVKSVSADKLIIMDGTEEDADWLIFKK